MGLTLEIEHRLKAKSFDEHYEDNTAKWVAMAATARTYTESFIDTDTEKVRPGDVAESLQNVIKIDPDFEAHLAAKKLTQKYWVRYFTDYILDRIYPTDITQ